MKKKNQLIKTLNISNTLFNLKNLNYFFNFKFIFFYNFFNFNFFFFIKNNFFYFLNFNNFFSYYFKKLFIIYFLKFIVFMQIKILYNITILNVFKLLKKWIFLSKYKPTTPSMRWKVNVKNSFKFNKIKNEFFFLKKKKNKFNIINYSSKRSIINFSNQINYKNSYCLISIKKIFNSIFYGVYKNIHGQIFLFKMINGSFLGDIFKNVFLPFKLLKKNFLGICTQIRNLTIYSMISNLTLKKNKPQLATSSGTYCQLLELKNNLNLGLIKLPSGFKKYITLDAFCITGRNSNIYHKYEVYSKASFFNFLGRKPDVRGVAKNPVDHPHGGRTKTNKPEVSPWGWVTKHSH